MRPGPGLVVMALAFLSGARRGGTTTIISSSTTTTTTSTPSITNNAISDAAAAAAAADDSSESADANHKKPKQRPPDEPDTDQFYDDPLNTDLFYADQPHRSSSQRDSVLSRINPWLSACDLAQPDSAPDLQVKDCFKIICE